MKDRIKQLRKELRLSQDEFGARLGIGKSSVSLIESGKNNPSEQTIRAICQQFSVRRLWLENGEGPMRLPPDEDDEIIDSVLAGSNDFVKAVIRGIAKTPGGWEAMREIFTAIQAELNKQKPDA
jgi:transcriptional regulator with XRE-family HTH domain